MTLGAGRGRGGTVMVLTLGTGIGTALFVDGRLLPNTELGHLEVHGIEAEHRASAKVRADRGLDWPEWAALVNEVLAQYHALIERSGLVLRRTHALAAGFSALVADRARP